MNDPIERVIQDDEINNVEIDLASEEVDAEQEERRLRKEQQKQENLELRKRIGKRITFLREAAGLTQLELAAFLDVSNKTISGWELGTKEFNVTTLIKIANFFQVTPDYLTEFEGGIAGMDNIISNEEFTVFLSLRKDKNLIPDLVQNPDRVRDLFHVWKSVRAVINRNDK